MYPDGQARPRPISSRFSWAPRMGGQNRPMSTVSGVSGTSGPGMAGIGAGIGPHRFVCSHVRGLILTLNVSVECLGGEGLRDDRHNNLSSRIKCIPAIPLCHLHGDPNTHPT